MSLTGRARWMLAALALAAFVAALYLQLPASLLLRFLPSPLPYPWTTAPGGPVVSGTIWDGELSGIAVLGHPLGRIHWQLSPWQALAGRFAGQVDLGSATSVVSAADGGPGRISATFLLDASGTGTISALDGEWPLAGLQPGTASPWRGRVVAKVTTVQFKAGEFAGGSGRVLVNGLAPPGNPRALGDFEVLWPAGNAAGDHQARVRDLNGAVELRAALMREPTGLWQLVGEAAPREGAPPDVRQALLMFGPPDNRGRHPLRLEFGLSPRP